MANKNQEFSQWTIKKWEDRKKLSSCLSYNCYFSHINRVGNGSDDISSEKLLEN